MRIRRAAPTEHRHTPQALAAQIVRVCTRMYRGASIALHSARQPITECHHDGTRSFCRWAIYVNAPSGLGRQPSQNRPRGRVRAGQRTCPAIDHITGAESDSASGHHRHRDGAYDFRVYASGLPPGPLRSSVPDGALTVTARAPGCRRCRGTCVPTSVARLCACGGGAAAACPAFPPHWKGFVPWTDG